MADRQLKIVVRTEIKKGFGDLSKQIQTLSKQLGQLSNLSSSVNKLALAFEKVGTGANVARQATAGLNKETNNAIRIVNQYASAQDKAAAKAVTLNNAVKSGAISKSAALKAEVAILNEAIKKTGDLSILERRRDSKGRFGYGGFSAAAVKEIKAKYATEASAVQQGGTRLVTEINNQNARIRAAMANMTRAGVRGSTGANRASLQGMYDNLFDADIPRATPKPTRRYGGGGGGFGNGGGGSGLVPPSNAASAVDKLMKSYTQLGHVLFQLQYATYTLFGFSGIAMIIKQSDAFIDLRNEIARTSDSTKDLGANMKDVFDIAKSTYSDAGAVGKLYSTVNKYSTDLGLSREQVGMMTKGISGAFAASPGTADAKAAAQYQFLQAFQSGRLGGDELRSILEQAPYVGDILAKGVGKVRGKDGPINLRDKNNPVTPQEIAKVFTDPEVLNEIMKTLADRARTFSDVMQVGRTRMLEYTQRVHAATGFMVNLNKGLADFIAGDKFMKLASALEDATVAALTFALVAGLGKGGGLAIKGVKAGATAVVGAGRSVIAGGTSVVNGARMMGSGGIEAGAMIGQFLKDLIPNILKFAKSLWSLKGIAMGIAGVIALLVGRFNSLLKASGSNINMFDILVWAFRKVTAVGKAVVGVLGNIFSPILNFIDKFLLSPLVRAVIGNKEIQDIANARVAANKAQEDALPSGQKSSIPGLAGDDSKGKGKKRDPWKEFITDTNQELARTKAMLYMPSSYADIEQAVQDIQKKAADALDLLNFEELQKKFPQKAAEVDKLSAKLKNLKLTEKINAFYDGIVDEMMQLKLDLPIPGEREGENVRRNNRVKGILKFLDDPNVKIDKYMADFGESENELVAKQSLKNRVKTLIGNGDLAQAESLVAAYLEDDGDGMKQFIADLNKVQEASERIKNTWQNGIKDGLAQVRDSYNDLAGEVTGIVTNMARSLESAMVGWIQTGKFEWKDFMSSILADLTTLFVRQRLLKPLFDWVGGKDSTSSNNPAQAGVDFITKAMEKMGLTGADGRGNPGEMGGVINGTPGSVQLPSKIMSSFGSMITKMLSSFTSIFTNILGGLGKMVSGGGGWFSTAISTIASIFHSGGIVGGAGTSRRVDASMFANAPRYHSGGIAGLAPNEVPAILQRGERVLSLAEQRRGGGGSTFAPVVSVQYNAAPSGGGQSSMSQEEHAQMLTKMVQNVIQQEIVNYDIKNRKPGSVGYVATKYN